jgi:hypothetical protein
MNARKRIFYTGLLAIFCASPAVSLAAKCGGTNINNTVTSVPTEIGKGTKLSILKFTSVIVSDDPSAPFHLASGECAGSFLISPDGKTSISGFCARKDKDGDVLYEEWVSSGGGVGTSKLLGGTGKFAKTAGASQWRNTPLYGTTSAVRWAGDCQ